jgi:hypothetical protein
LELLLNSGDVGINGFIKQTRLASIKLFAAAAKLPALEDSHLMRELVDLGLAVQDLAVLAGDGLVQAGYLLVECIDLEIACADLLIVTSDLCDQISDNIAQLLCVQTGQ